MSYFTEILTLAEGEWRALDLDVRDYATLEDLAEVMRSVSDPEGEALAVIEHEDDWFGLVRLFCEDEELRVFLSDADAAAESPFGELFAEYLNRPELLARRDEEEPEEFEEDGADEGEQDSGEGAGVADEDADPESELDGGAVPPPSPGWAGDADIFADRGISQEELLEQVALHSSDPARVVAHIGEAAGFAEQLEAVR